jgi:DNA-binding NarL/FixJ family response regulator
LRALLDAQPNWEVAAEAVSGREAVDLAKKLTPGSAIIDVGMPELNGQEATRQILEGAAADRASHSHHA